jgi:hypothetical protein
MVKERSAVVLAAIATVIACLVLAACSAGVVPSPSAPTSSASESAVPSGTATPEPAPAFVRKYMAEVPAGNSSDFAVSDLNEDGKFDLVTTSHIFGVVVLFGNGDGTFTAAPNIEVAGGELVRAADLNGDGHVDLVAAGDQLSVLLGKGDGTFAPPVSYAAGSDVSNSALNLLGLAVADLNGDSIPDLVATNWVASQLSVLPGKGDGTFEAASLYTCPACVEVAAGDLNQDAHVDIVAASTSGSGSATVLLNDGTGHLGEPVGYNAGGNAVTIALGDLNSDGALDAVTGNDGSGSLSVLLGKGDGTLGDAQTYPAGNTHAIAVVDLNGDAKPDVLSGTFEVPMLWFYRGTGDGTLIETQGIDATPDLARSLAVADFNDDGKPDLALYYSGVKAFVSILLGE